MDEKNKLIVNNTLKSFSNFLYTKDNFNINKNIPNNYIGKLRAMSRSRILESRENDFSNYKDYKYATNEIKSTIFSGINK